jgi:hypothetical protein
MAPNDEFVDKLIEGYEKPEDLIRENGTIDRTSTAFSNVQRLIGIIR